jgi:hypothetical protein
VTELFQRERHEPLTGSAWSDERARRAIEAIVAETEYALGADDLWPLHPADDEPGDPAWLRLGVYMGAAGVIWALDRLPVELRRDWSGVADRLHARYLASGDLDAPGAGLWMGEAGMLLVAQLLAPAAARADLLEAVVRGNVDHPSNELMWGNPGTMAAAQALLDASGDERWREPWRLGAERLWDEWRLDEELGCHLWTQRFRGREDRVLGPAHGLAGNVRVLARGHAGGASELTRRAVEAAERFAVRDGAVANWPPEAGGALVNRHGEVRVQWCHGAPGIVASLAGLAPDDEAFGELLVAGGELTWAAGPLLKGPGLCHGTAGNGLALLKLFERTGDELWLDRARRFGVHALEQVERARREAGRGRFSLWTGDLGVALYLRGCLDGRAEAPMLDPAV